MVQLQYVLFQKLLIVPGVGVLIDHNIVLPDLELIRFDTSHNIEVNSTNFKLNLNLATFAINGIDQLGFINVAMRFTEQTK